MTEHHRDFAQWLGGLLHLRQVREREQEIIRGVVEGRQLSQDTEEVFEEQLTFGQRLADRVAEIGGSWGFIIGFGVAIVGWVVVNVILLSRSFDPYPFILLNLFLSMLAAVQAPVIMMSQNRQEQKDRLRAINDYEVNLKAELEIRALHEKLDSLRDQQWAELVSLQQDQIRLLTALAERQQQQIDLATQLAQGAAPANDPGRMNLPPDGVT